MKVPRGHNMPFQYIPSWWALTMKSVRNCWLTQTTLF